LRSASGAAALDDLKTEVDKTLRLRFAAHQ
jgi:hypothetical protein